MTSREECGALPGCAQGSGGEAGRPYEPMYLLLGPLEVRRAGMPCTPTARKRRALLALLLLHANRTLPVDALIDELWDGRPPRSAVATLQMYVSGLRRTLDPGHSREGRDARRHPLLRTSGAGYLLRVRPGELDLDRFRTMAVHGRELMAAGDCPAAAESFRQALALWRGTPLGDLGQSGLPAHYAVRLEEERLALVRDRIGADICRGRAHEVVGELEELCARHPLREGFHEQLMLALAATGRLAEALDAYARARRTVVDNTGIEPGPGLRSTQRALLSGDLPANTGHDRCGGLRALQPTAFHR
ncbi:AfsR/SARP family transcriptional regulator [Streptomyces sp. PR69]|uniref:AfsR/SARP family transcriptional regulator n=1 Tax=Streptomyces sp. PR69 TaxID=2984950 RepID=UPI002264D4E2|nr:AfsR/SARP family transcriptional regulator [Streptomyces sp. PR69]